MKRLVSVFMDTISSINKTTFLISLGAGIYWAAMVAGFSSDARPVTVALEEYRTLSWLLSQSTAILIAVVATFLSARFASRKVQRALAFVTFLVNAVVLIAELFGRGIVDIIGANLIWLSLKTASGACLMLFWGLNFASLEKKNAEHTVLSAVFICWALTFLMIAIPSKELATVLGMTAKTISPLLFLFGGYTLKVSKRTFRPEATGTLLGFVLSRMLLGIAAGIASYFALLVPQQLGTPRVPLLIFLSIVALCCAWYSSRFNRTNMPLLTASPLILLLVLLFVFQKSDSAIGSPSTMVLAVIWFAWIVLSSTQISEFKEVFGLDEVFLSFGEKTIITFFWTLGGVSIFILDNELTDMRLMSMIFEQFSLVAILLWLIIVIYSFVKLAGAKERGKLIDYSISSPDRQIDEICLVIANEYSLSAREGEVLALLARGHTRAYTCEFFSLSSSTVRSHVSHIYQKLGINNRELLFQIIEKYKTEVALRKRYRK